MKSRRLVCWCVCVGVCVGVCVCLCVYLCTCAINPMRAFVCVHVRAYTFECEKRHLSPYLHLPLAWKSRHGATGEGAGVGDEDGEGLLEGKEAAEEEEENGGEWV